MLEEFIRHRGIFEGDLIWDALNHRKGKVTACWWSNGVHAELPDCFSHTGIREKEKVVAIPICSVVPDGCLWVSEEEVVS